MLQAAGLVRPVGRWLWIDRRADVVAGVVALPASSAVSLQGIDIASFAVTGVPVPRSLGAGLAGGLTVVRILAHLVSGVNCAVRVIESAASGIAGREVHEAFIGGPGESVNLAWVPSSRGIAITAQNYDAAAAAQMAITVLLEAS